MNEKRQQVASAIANELWRYAETWFDPKTIDLLAGAAIAAMREPTESMITAGHAADDISDPVDRAATDKALIYGDIWRAMNAAALKE